MAVVSLNLSPSVKALRQFGLLALLFFGAVGTWAILKDGSGSGGFARFFGSGAVFLGLVSGGLALLAPRALLPLFVVLTLVTFPIGFVVSHIILALLYFGFLTPIGLLLRVFGTDPMQRTQQPGRDSYWEPARPRTDPRSYFRQY